MKDKVEEKEDVRETLRKERNKYHKRLVAVVAAAVGLGFLLGRKS